MTINTLKILINTLKHKPEICQKQNFYSSRKFYKNVLKIYKILKKYT